MGLANRLTTLRSRHDITQQELADKIGVSRGTVGMYEIGKREPDADTLGKIADYFNVSTDYLLGRTDQKKSPEAELPLEFTTPEEAMKFVLEQNVIMGFGGFDVDKMDDEEIIEFANELLNHLKLLSYKYKK